MDQGRGPDHVGRQFRCFEKDSFFNFSKRNVEPTRELSCSAPFDGGGQTRKVHFFGDARESRVALMFVMAIVNHVLTLGLCPKTIQFKTAQFPINCGTEAPGVSLLL